MYSADSSNSVWSPLTVLRHYYYYSPQLVLYMSFQAKDLTVKGSQGQRWHLFAGNICLTVNILKHHWVPSKHQYQSFHTDNITSEVYRRTRILAKTCSTFSRDLQPQLMNSALLQPAPPVHTDTHTHTNMYSAYKQSCLLVYDRLLRVCPSVHTWSTATPTRLGSP